LGILKPKKEGSIIMQSPSTVTRSVLKGFMAAFPIVVGYLPIGIAYGVLAIKLGLSPFNTLLMSLVVYAGSSQLIAIGLFSSGAAPMSIILTTFIVNLRHLLMTAALSSYLRRWRRFDLSGFAFQVTDESFGVHVARFARGQTDKTEAFAINITAQCAWIAGTFIGIIASELITDTRQLALDYALPAMFIGLLVLACRNRKQVLVAAVAGCLSVVLLLAGLEQWHVIVATLIGGVVGIGMERWTRS
jgi:4-azaleucine resistance transporter AzlC